MPHAKAQRRKEEREKNDFCKKSITSEAGKDSFADYKLPRQPLEQQLHLQNLIHQGICSIVQQKSDWISHNLCETVQLGSEPSHWFG